MDGQKNIEFCAICRGAQHLQSHDPCYNFPIPVGAFRICFSTLDVTFVFNVSCSVIVYRRDLFIFYPHFRQNLSEEDSFIANSIENGKLVKKFPAFMAPESPSPYPQVRATCPYPEPALSSRCPHIPLMEDPYESHSIRNIYIY